MSNCNERDLSDIRGKITGSTPFRPVFFKGMWMAIPLPFIPPAANGEEDMKGEQPSEGAIEIFGSIVPYLWQCSQLRDFCQRQDIPFFWVTGISERKERKKVVQESSWAKTKPLSGKQFRSFLKFLPSQIQVMAELYWFINRKMFQKIGLFYGWEELCYIATDALPDSRPGEPTVMTFYRTSSYGAREEHHVAHYLPYYLEKRIRKLLSDESILIFRQKNSGKSQTISSYKMKDLSTIIAKVCKELSLKNICMIGLNNGANIAIDTVLNHSLPIEKLILIDPPIFMDKSFISEIEAYIELLEKEAFDHQVVKSLVDSLFLDTSTSNKEIAKSAFNSVDKNALKSIFEGLLEWDAKSSGLLKKSPAPHFVF